MCFVSIYDNSILTFFDDYVLYVFEVH